MEATSFPETGTGFDGSQVDEIVDRDAYYGFYAFCLALAIFLDIFVVSIIVYLFTAKPKSDGARSAPKHVAILACCIVQILAAVFPYSLTLHLSHLREQGVPFQCFAVIAASVGFCGFDSLTLLIITVVTLAETFSRDFLVVASRSRQVVYAVVLLVLAIAYAFAGVVPIFFVVSLAERERPCLYAHGIPELNFSKNSAARCALPAAKFLVPFLLLITSQFLLKLTECVRPKYTPVQQQPERSSGPSEATTSERAEGTADDQDTTTTTTTPLVGKTSDGRKKVTISVQNGSTGKEKPSKTQHSGAPVEAKRRRSNEFSVAMNLRLAGLFASAFYFLEFFLTFAYWDLVGEPDPSNMQYVRLKAASEFLKVLVLVVVPICWLMDKDVRAVIRRFSRCRRR